MRFMRSNDRFIYYMHPLMSRFISALVAEMEEHPAKPKYLLYGNFPGNEVFFHMLDEVVCNAFENPIILPVDRLDDIRVFLGALNEEDESYDLHDRFIWLQIQDIDEYAAHANDFSCLINDKNRELWYTLDDHKDKSVRILVTFRCKTPSLFGRDKNWKRHFGSEGLFRIINLPMDFGYALADESDNARMNYGYKMMTEYYKEFKKNVLSYGKYLKRERRHHMRQEARSHQWGVTYEKQNSYPYNQTVPGNSIDAFLKLVGDVNKKYGIDIEMDPSSAQYQQKYGNSGDMSDLTSLIQKAAMQQQIFENVEITHSPQYNEDKIHTAALLAEAKAIGDPDYIKYLQACNLNEEVHKALEDIGGEDYDGDGTMFVQI